MATFSTWAALLTQMRNDLASRDFTVASYRGPDGREFKYRTVEELIKLEGYITARADADAATSGAPTRRVYVRPQGNTW